MSQRYAAVDPNGRLQGFYSDDITPIAAMPSNAVAISDAVWRAWLANGSGQVLVGGVLQPFTPPPPPNPVTITAMDYFARFSTDQTTAIHTAALASPPTATSLQLFNFLLLVAASGVVDLTNPVVIGGHQVLVALGLLTATQSAVILTP